MKKEHEGKNFLAFLSILLDYLNQLTLTISAAALN